MEGIFTESAEDTAPTTEQVHTLLIFPISFTTRFETNELPSMGSLGISSIDAPIDVVSEPAAEVPGNRDETEVVKAEMSFYSTPHTEEFKRPVYETLKRIQDSCHDDFVEKCSGANSLRRGNPLNQRHLSAIFSKMDHQRERDSFSRHSDIQYLNRAPEHDGQDQDQDGPPDGQRDRNPPGPGRGEGERIPPPPNAGGPQNPEIPSTRRGSWGSHDGEDSDSDDEEDGHDHDHHGRDHHDHHHDDHHHHHQIEEDVWFSGSLGFGQDGDTCLYENFAKVSNQCQYAVQDLHELRSTYWQQEVNSREGPPMGHPCFFFFIVSAAFIVFLVFYNLKTRKMRKLNRAVMDAIESNPHLRAQGNAYPLQDMS